MAKVKEIYHGAYPCDDCAHVNVCNVKECFEESKVETIHPYVEIVLKCREHLPNYLIRIFCPKCGTDMRYDDCEEREDGDSE